MNNSFVASSLLSCFPFFLPRSTPSFLSRANCPKVAPDEGGGDDVRSSLCLHLSHEEPGRCMQIFTINFTFTMYPGLTRRLLRWWKEVAVPKRMDGRICTFLRHCARCLLFSSKRYLPAARDAPEMRHARRRRRERAIYGTRKSQGDS